MTAPWRGMVKTSVSLRTPRSLPAQRSRAWAVPEAKPACLRWRREAAHGAAVVGEVEDGVGDGAVGERACPDLGLFTGPDAVALLAELVLVDGDHVLVGEDGRDRRRSCWADRCRRAAARRAWPTWSSGCGSRSCVHACRCRPRACRGRSSGRGRRTSRGRPARGR